jgi:hypothetical protein
MSGSAAAVLGKVPWHPEFLRGPQLSAELWAFDEWLFGNAQRRMVEAPGRASYGFLLQLGPTETPLSGIAGVISPSHDLAGRRYPLAIAGRVVLARDVAAHPEILPIVLEDYWHTAVEIMTEARRGPPDGDDWRLERLSQVQMGTGQTAFDLYAEWAEQMGASQLCALLGRPAGWLAGAAATVAQAVSPQGGGRMRSIRVPLGQAAGGALCFWLDVVRRAACWQSHVPSFFWSHDEHGGDALVFVGGPGDTALATLWGGDACSDVCDLTAQDDATGAASRASSSLSASEGGTEGNLWPVLESVETLVKAQSL